MLFNSLNFLLFFPTVAVLFFVLPHRWRWVLLLLASYLFYACWRPAYLGLILLITGSCYAAAAVIARSASAGARRLALLASLGICLGTLFLFKYLGFAAETVHSLGNALGLGLPVPAWQLILPVGISFYTFQALSYTLDVYRGSRAHEPHPGIFALYVSFFPQLVAGPIERSTQLMPQFGEEMRFDYERVVSGLRWMLWGMFKKVVVADNLARFVKTAYGPPLATSGTSLALGTLFFAIQIYCDFSGYSDIALGAARVLGFRLTRNFATPYFSRSFTEFWRRWHISLTTWFRDYVYIPLGGNRQGRWATYRNCAIVFLISGLWHGAAWTFVVWGALHGTFLIAEAILRHHVRQHEGHPLVQALRQSPVVAGVRRAIVFVAVMVGWVFFRARSIGDAMLALKRIGQGLLSIPQQLAHPGPGGFAATVFMGHSRAYMAVALVAVVSLVVGDCLLVSARFRRLFHAVPHAVRLTLYFGLAMSILLLGVVEDENPFIYFQF